MTKFDLSWSLSCGFQFVGLNFSFSIFCRHIKLAIRSCYSLLLIGMFVISSKFPANCQLTIRGVVRVDLKHWTSWHVTFDFWPFVSWRSGLLSEKALAPYLLADFCISSEFDLVYNLNSWRSTEAFSSFSCFIMIFDLLRKHNKGFCLYDYRPISAKFPELYHEFLSSCFIIH